MTTSDLKQVDHVCLSSIDWGYLWQGHQEVMARFARRGSRVLYVENTGVRAARLTDWKRLIARLRAGSGSVIRSRHPVPGVELLAPLALPFPWSRVARRVNRMLLADRLPDRVARMGMTAPVAWSFLPTPLALDTFRALRRTRSAAVYYCVADFDAVSDHPEDARRAELELLGEVDLVLAGARTLQRRLAQHHPRVILAPFSVADVFFEPPGSVPDDLRAIPHPRIGYVGGLHRHVDSELMEGVFRLLPDVQFVFVGPDIGEHVSERFRAPNVHLLGRRPQQALPAYISGFDVCVIPYVLSDFTKSVAPMKFHEYLALGKPVVSTPLQEVRLLGYDDDLVRIAATPAEFAAAIRAALSAPEGAADRRRSAARAYSWAVLFETILRELRAVIRDDRLVV